MCCCLSLGDASEVDVAVVVVVVEVDMHLKLVVESLSPTKLYWLRFLHRLNCLRELRWFQKKVLDCLERNCDFFRQGSDRVSRQMENWSEKLKAVVTTKEQLQTTVGREVWEKVLGEYVDWNSC